MKRLAMVVIAAFAGALLPQLLSGCEHCTELEPLTAGTYLPTNPNDGDYRLVLASDQSSVETFTTPDGHHYEIHYTGGPWPGP